MTSGSLPDGGTAAGSRKQRRPRRKRKRKEERFMTTALRIGIIGDYQPAYRPHPATNEALDHAARSLSVPIEVTWLPTASLEGPLQPHLQVFDALWCAPGSPYQSLTG